MKLNEDGHTYAYEAVAPHAGAWIEIRYNSDLNVCSWSLPMRERGLKCNLPAPAVLVINVAPHAGAWIEIRRRAGVPD